MRVRRILMESLPVLMLATAITVVAGVLLNTAMSIGDVIGIFIITPAIIGTGGNLGTSFGARISTQLHSGLIEPRFKRYRLVYINFIALFICGIIVSLTIGCIAFLLRILLVETGFSLPEFLIIATASGSIIYGVMLFLSLFIAFITFRKGLDPDNLIAPLITTIADLIGIASILLVSHLIMT